VPPQPSAHDPRSESFRPNQGWPAGQRWPGDEDWPVDDDWPDDDPSGIGWAGDEIPPASAHDGGPRRRRLRGGLGLAVVAVLAAAAGAGLAWPFTGADHRSAATGASGSPSSAAPGATPGSTTPGGATPGGQSGLIPGPAGGYGGSPGTGPVTQIFITGTVRAVSPTSITIAGPGQSLTAAVTGSTRITGRVSSIRSIGAGDQVSAQIVRSGGKTTALAIQDPPVSAGIP
jgi:hypothetical protein